MASAFRAMMRTDRERLGLSVARASWLIDVCAPLSELEEGEGYPDFETWDRMCKLFGWSQTFVGAP